MAIQVASNFTLKSKNFLDSRQSFDTVSAMTSFDVNGLPDGIITYVKENDTYYKFLSENSVDENLGKWREYNDDTKIKNDISTINEKITELENKEFTFETFDTKPTEDSTIGKIVFNSSPKHDEYVGWVYTALGWLGFGKVESDPAAVPEDAIVFSDGEPFLLSDGSYFLCA